MTRFFGVRSWIAVLGVLGMSKAASAQCSGLDFSADTLSGCPPLQVTFYAHNVPANGIIYWDFGTGNGYLPGTDSMTRFFLEPGHYTVRLRVISGTDTCEVVKTDYVQVGGIPNPTFTVDTNVLCNTGQSVTFTDVNYADSTRDWVIDGYSYFNAGRTITHTFNSPGWKSVILRVWDSSGCATIITDDSAVYVSAPPSLSFTAGVRTGCKPLTVLFSPNIVKGSAAIASVEWSFPGGTPASHSGNTPPPITYSTPGNYDVTLTVTTSSGCTYSFTRSNYVRVGDTADLSYTLSSSSVCQGEEVLLTMNNPTSLPGTFSWNVGGTIVQNGMPDSLRIAYPTPGAKTISVSFSYNGCSNSRVDSNVVFVSANDADFTALNTTDCSPPHSVAFSDASSASSAIVSRTWRFYDSDDSTVLGTSNALAPSWTYADFGRFDVFLHIVQANGCEDSVRKADFVIIDSIQPMAAPQSNYVCMYDSVAIFEAGSQNLPTDPNDTAFFSFFLIDSLGNILDSIVDTTESSIFFNVPDSGCYGIIYEIQTQSGCYGIDTFENSFCATAPTVDFSVDTNQICTGVPMGLHALATPPDYSYVYQWELYNVDSGTTITLSGANPTVTFTQAGVYTVTLYAFSGTCSDTIVKTNHITVRDLQAGFTLSSFRGCSPSMTLNMSSVISSGFALPMSYRWYVYPSDPNDTAVITSPTALSTTATLYSADESRFTVALAVTNAYGCSDSVVMQNVVRVGTTVGLSASARRLCFGDTLTLSDNSNPDIQSIQWQVMPSATLIPDDTSRTVRVAFPDSGWYAIRVIGQSDIGCRDTAYDSVYIEKVAFDFAAVDSFYSCAPVFVMFNVLDPKNVVSYHWDFGDGTPPISTPLTSTIHVYRTNSGDSTSGFTVRLVGVSANGCRDTVEKTKYIKVIGPNPKFEMINNIGCEPLQVTFIDSSSNIVEYYLDYGDGSPLDTAFVGSHTYTVFDTTRDYQVFYPTLLAVDPAGCVIVYPTLDVDRDSVVVYIRPRVDFTAAPLEGCQPLQVTLKAQTYKATVWNWDVDANGTIDAVGDSVAYAYTTADTFSVRLIGYSDYGCSDTALKTDHIVVHPLPTAHFAILDTLLCYTDSLRLQDLSYGDYPLVRWWWDYGDFGSLADTSTLPNPPPYYYGKDGVFSIMLIVEDIHGCRDTTIRPQAVTVLDTIPGAAPAIDYVSTHRFVHGLIEWQPADSFEFSRYYIHRSDNFGNRSVVDSVFEVDSTRYIDSVPPLDVNTARYCYEVQFQDICGLKSGLSDPHCLIYLRVFPEGERALRLEWSPYVGWDSVTAYRVYRMDSVPRLLATLPPSDTTYLDSNLCDERYCYYVEALHPGGVWRSLSNMDCDTPVYPYQGEPYRLYYVSVTPDHRVEMAWEEGSQSNLRYYELSWRDTSGVWRDDYARMGVGTTSWIDGGVDPTIASHWYRVRTVDECGYVGPWSNLGKTIWLRAAVLPSKAVALSWTPYGDWPAGVKEYQVMRLRRNGDYEVLTTLPGTVTSFVDSSSDPGRVIDTILCYKVLAVENTPTPDSGAFSYSNRVCPHMDILVYIPTAFTPNSDNVNDIFRPSLLYVLHEADHRYRQYEFWVFNRWGERVFYTTNIKEGWSGLIDGEPAPEGYYHYMIKVADINGMVHFYKGEVLLLR